MTLPEALVVLSVAIVVATVATLHVTGHLPSAVAVAKRAGEAVTRFAHAEPVVVRRLLLWAAGLVVAAAAVVGLELDAGEVVGLVVVLAGVGAADASTTKRQRAQVYPAWKVDEFLADAEGRPGARHGEPGQFDPDTDEIF